MVDEGQIRGIAVIVGREITVVIIVLKSSVTQNIGRRRHTTQEVVLTMNQHLIVEGLLALLGSDNSTSPSANLVNNCSGKKFKPWAIDTGATDHVSYNIDQLSTPIMHPNIPLIEDTQTAQTIDPLEVQPVPDQSNTIYVPSTSQSIIATSAPVDTNASRPQQHRTMPTSHETLQ
ncbi:hypothetical protein GH714_029998 [Hevea brasiliensis]|uniref:Uncharacterized protein n=1 Tax=Hevea brasiliensis TaxID=3981 RepID=A0A6A6LHD1_HEVBR|nr:hypothetical protein GH714_029998 [Hevea brasiliensis]